MFPRALLLLGFLLSSFSLEAVVLGPAVPLPWQRVIPAATAGDPVVVASGERALVVWNEGEGAARIDQRGEPLDKPAIVLPKPSSAAVDVVATPDGWTVGWLLFEFSDRPGALRLVDISHEGVLGSARDVALPFRLNQALPAQFARRGILLAALPALAGTAVVTVNERGVTLVATIDGRARELIATSDGFALLLEDRVVRLSANGEPSSSVALPAGFRAHDLASGSGALYVAGNLENHHTALVRIGDTSNAAAVVATVPHLSRDDVRIATAGNDVLLVWKSPDTMPPVSGSSYHLVAARIRGGSGAGRVELRQYVDPAGFDRPPGPADVAVVNGRPVVVWRPYTANVFSMVVDEELGVSSPVVVSWRVADQRLAGMAAADGVVLVVWTEPAGGVGFTMPYSLAFAARFDARGMPLDPQPLSLGMMMVGEVKAAGPAFLITGSLSRRLAYAYIGKEGPPRILEGAAALPRLEVSCTPQVCIAAWVEWREGASLRVSRWADGVLLDAPGLFVASTDTEYTGIALENDGRDFAMVVARRGSPAGGTILEAARIGWRDGAWQLGTLSPFAANHGAGALRLFNQPDHYLAVWSEGAAGVYASRLSRDAQSLDGEETSWRGWPVIDVLAPFAIDSDGHRTYFVRQLEQGSRLFELRGRDVLPLSEVGPGVASIACTGSGRCLLAVESRRREDTLVSPLLSPRIALRTFERQRVRAVRR